jgi:hypothetical protein
MESKPVILGTLELIHLITHPLRYKLLKHLEEFGETSLPELERILNEKRELINFHVLTLEQHGLLTSRLAISEVPHSKGKAIKKVKVTPKFHELRTKLKEL